MLVRVEDGELGLHRRQIRSHNSGISNSEAAYISMKGSMGPKALSKGAWGLTV